LFHIPGTTGGTATVDCCASGIPVSVKPGKPLQNAAMLADLMKLRLLGAESVFFIVSLQNNLGIFVHMIINQSK
jgi:hypothetical protein